MPRIEPENTLRSFRRAVELGADGIELDLRTSLDGDFLVMHDKTLDRTTSGSGCVHLRRTQAIRQLDAGAWFVGQPTDEHVPVIEEVFEALPSPLYLNLELKMGPAAVRAHGRKLAGILEARGAVERVIVSGFSVPVLKAFRRVAPDIAIGFLGDDVEMAVGMGATALHPWAGILDASLAARARNAGLRLHPWGADEVVDLERMLDLGVHAIITDEVARLRALVKSR